MLIKLTLLLTVTTLFIGCNTSDASPSTEFAKSFARVKIKSTTGDKTPIRLGDGLTIVNIFDEFSTGCPTGNRFETMERFNSLQPPRRILLIFSEKHFSTQDVNNFKAMLPMSESLMQGDIEAVRSHLLSGKLLVVLDSKGNVLWHEKPDMSEQQIMSHVSELLPASN
jgi:hypothetical protein